MSDVLARRDHALSPEEVTALLRDRLGEAIVEHTVEYRTFTVWVRNDAWAEAARVCRDEPALDFDLFDCLFGVDARDDGFDVVAVLYSTSTGMRVALRTRCEGRRDEPTCPSITEIYRGADWMERETWDMFGIDFPGHPGLAPRLLTVENFEGWPLRKDFVLTSRVVKPWPGVKEPAELDEEGNVVEREPEIGGAPGPYDLDKAMAAQAKAVNAPAGAEIADTDDAEDDADTDDVEDEGDAQDEAQDAAASAGEEREGSEDAAAAASARADERRREQAEARRRKAAERAGEDQDVDGQDIDDQDVDDPGEEDDA